MATALEQARTQLTELIENARSGNIIPVRLPGQLEAIAELLGQADEEQAAAANKGPALSGDAEELMKDGAQFISVAIHELRTPMTSIRGYTDMLASPAMGELSATQQQFLDTIRSNARRMEGLLTDVSDMAKIRSGTLKITEKMDMYKNIAMAVEKEMAPAAEEMGKTLVFDTPQGLPLLNTDGEFFAKAMSKLVENGLRYSNENGTVTVTAAGQDSTLVVTIADNGIGMDEDELTHLGEIYWRSENEIVRTFKGSGLGVPIAFGIIELLGGKISVDSTPDVGTTFTIQLQGMT